METIWRFVKETAIVTGTRAFKITEAFTIKLAVPGTETRTEREMIQELKNYSIKSNKIFYYFKYYTFPFVE